MNCTDSFSSFYFRKFLYLVTMAFRTMKYFQDVPFSVAGFKRKSFLEMYKILFPSPPKICRRIHPYTKTALLFTVAQCVCSSEKGNILIQAPSPQKLTHEYLITQACTSTVSAAQQLLTVTLAAVTDTAKIYRECMEKLMRLMDDSLEVQDFHSSQSSLWDEVIATRAKVADCKNRLQELSSFMEYVDKLATSAAESAYLGGAEHMSTVMCETLNSAHAKLEVEYNKTTALEKEFLKHEEAFVHKACEIEKEQKSKQQTNKDQKC